MFPDTSYFSDVLVCTDAGVVQSVLPVETVANVDTWTWTPSLGTGVRIMVLLPFVLNAMPVMRVPPLKDRMRQVKTHEQR
jgi:hypothetical protein